MKRASDRKKFGPKIFSTNTRIVTPLTHKLTHELCLCSAIAWRPLNLFTLWGFVLSAALTDASL